ncbi:hypothetical protein Q3G72_011897 [Acer saccharum]|nr:hypothetical protein Q3G72_011897 [Acer saccharum]
MASAFFYIPTVNALPNHNRIPFTSPKLATKLQAIRGGNSPILTEKTLLHEFSIEDYRTKTLRKIHKELDEAVPLQYPTTLHEAMRYTILAGKERFFPTICVASGELVGGDESSVMAMACAIEMVNTVGLVLDDLPCMDNDDLRRGKTASHKVFGEATTILACNALMCLAADHLITKTKHVVSPNHLFQATVEMYSAFGSKGCTAGQIADMDSEGKELSLDELEFIHNHKTGRLIEAAAVCGVLIGGGNEVEVERVRRFGKNVGLAFQVWDDILDEIGSTEKLGKKVGRDLLRNKATYPKLIGMDESKKFARELVAKAHEELTYFDSTKAAPMYHLANFVVNSSLLIAPCSLFTAICVVIQRSLFSRRLVVFSTSNWILRRLIVIGIQGESLGAKLIYQVWQLIVALSQIDVARVKHGAATGIGPGKRFRCIWNLRIRTSRMLIRKFKILLLLFFRGYGGSKKGDRRWLKE